MILIVDDKADNLFSLKTLLQLHAYDVDTASSGEEALKKILKNEYALVILDVQMPEMDGYEVAESITGYSKTKNLPIIFLSAVNIDKRFITKGYASGGVDYVTKPFDPDLLLLKVKTFYRLYLQAKELNQTKKELEEINTHLEEKVKERTQELFQINKELETSNTELQQYASVASHDLQEPLRKIITFSRMLQEKLAEDSHPSKYIDKIVASAVRMRTLIDDLLNYSRLSSSSDFEYTDLTQILNETLEDLELSIAEKQAQIITDPLPCAEVVPGQLRQVFQNIISNALKFSNPQQHPVIKIAGEYIAEKDIDAAKTPKGPYLRISITDNGIGFDEVYAEKIFNLFQRLHGKEMYAGTGIGLAIVKKIIEKHNGLLNARSKEGKGTTIVFVLPVKQTSTVQHDTNNTQV